MDQTSDMPTGSARSARSPSFLYLRGRAGACARVKRAGSTAHARYVPVASLIACLVAVAAASLWQATGHAGQTGPQPRAAEAGTGAIRIVVALPLTGPRRAAGAAARQRLALVTSAIDAQGGLGQRPLEIEILDDGCSREGARDVAMRIASAPKLPSAVIGHPCASAAITAAAIYQQGGVLFIYDMRRAWWLYWLLEPVRASYLVREVRAMLQGLNIKHEIRRQFPFTQMVVVKK